MKKAIALILCALAMTGAWAQGHSRTLDQRASRGNAVMTVDGWDFDVSGFSMSDFDALFGFDDSDDFSCLTPGNEGGNDDPGNDDPNGGPGNGGFNHNGGKQGFTLHGGYGLKGGRPGGLVDPPIDIIRPW